MYSQRAKGKMKIIAIEGLDKSGKHSTAKGLAEKLIADGHKVAISEFHRYDTPTGQLIRQWLYGEYKVNQHTIELIMAADKYAQQEYFNELESEGHDILILDRYIGSHYVYAEAAGSDPNWIEILLQYVARPDIEIFIDISPETSMKRKGKHGENDRYESDFDLLTKVRHNFLKPRHYHSEGNWPGTIFAKVGGEKTVNDSIEDAYTIVSEALTVRR